MNTIHNNTIEVSVVVNGRPVRIYPHEGKYFIESRENTEYIIEIANKNWFRVEAVVAVDGLSVLTGNAAGVDDNGYIVNGQSKIQIKGFRKSMDEVGAFKFVKKDKSYATEKGSGQNNGVIAVAVYKENTYNGMLFHWTTYPSGAKSSWYVPTSDKWVNQDHVPDQSTYSRDVLRSVTLDTGVIGYNASASCVDDAKLSSNSFEHGTGWGNKLQDKITMVQFNRGDLIYCNELFYDSKNNLQSYGIKIVPEKSITLPTGFPMTFAEPPRNWNPSNV